jgi:hypothetical protein
MEGGARLRQRETAAREEREEREKRATDAMKDVL